jgi:hypothetical protein
MVTNNGGRAFMKKVARYCRECTVWFWRKFWLSIYCPCCHKKMHDELKNPLVPPEVKRVEYFRQWNLKNREKRNKYKSEWAKEKRKRLKCANVTFAEIQQFKA